MEIRKPREDEYRSIYLMGFDVWSEGKSKDKYVEECTENTKYKAGTWFVLASEDVLASSLIVYESQFEIPENFCGIGSVATAIQHRKKGYSSELINGVCENLKSSGYSGVYLHSDIDPEFYKRLGFIPVSTEVENCMVRLFGSVKVPEKAIPSYF